MRGLQRDDADGENLSSVDTLSKRGKNVEKRDNFIANIHETRPLVINERRRNNKNNTSNCVGEKQGQIHGSPVADSWAGAEFRNVTDGRTDGQTDRPTQQGVESCVRD